jgi:hypothetical protein
MDNNSANNKWTINEEAFKKWLGSREAEFHPALDPVPTLKALVFLALLDSDAPSSGAQGRAAIKISVG